MLGKGIMTILKMSKKLIITEEEIEVACRIILQAVEIAASEIKSL